MQVIGALTTNAMRHTPVDTSVRIRGVSRPRRRGSVADHGPGIVAGDETRGSSIGSTAPIRAGHESPAATGSGSRSVASIVSAHGGTYGVVPYTLGIGWGNVLVRSPDGGVAGLGDDCNRPRDRTPSVGSGGPDEFGNRYTGRREMLVVAEEPHDGRWKVEH